MRRQTVGGGAGKVTVARQRTQERTNFNRHLPPWWTRDVSTNYRPKCREASPTLDVLHPSDHPNRVNPIPDLPTKTPSPIPFRFLSSDPFIL
jgi:hypothetical protein